MSLTITWRIENAFYFCLDPHNAIRYHNIDGSGGFAICETDDASALANWAIDWNGLIDVKITPIMDDETIGGVLGPRAEEFD